ncbi:D-glycerate dehydrogenase [Nakamurella sp. YIM 132087]|uniref:D-glycerate dehydrogenase n=1 Tax=Nakamurella alba TaxID=2665158 RepID=A0A7K1FHF7_9ACTN|nr:D-glycerate dehydrogenase [Nakamurella alba]MTD13510.1 D-glycerate dehydrogenase [Nakamurella alba]
MTGLPRVLVTRRALPGTGLDRLLAAAEVVQPIVEPPSPTDLQALAPGATVILAPPTDPVDEALLDAAGPGLRLVAVIGAGYDLVDRKALRDRGIALTNTPDVLAETTADLTFGLVLSARRRLTDAERALRAGEWTGFRMDGFLGQDVHGATLGIIGYGQIGKAVARRGTGFGMRILHLQRASAPSDSMSTAVDMDTLLAESDVLCLTVPRTPDTRNLIGAAELARMKPTATLVNTARGGIVDEAAVLEALRAGRLHSAGLDVFDTEPLPVPGSPLLEEIPGLVLLPHIGSATEATRAAMVDKAVDNALAVLAGGEPLTPVG